MGGMGLHAVEDTKNKQKESLKKELETKQNLQCARFTSNNTEIYK